MRIRHLAPRIGAEIEDFDLATGLDDAGFAAIEEVFNDRGVLLLRGQHLSEQRQGLGV